MQQKKSHSSYKRGRTATDESTSKMEESIEKYKSEFEDIQYCLVVFKTPERRDADFEDATNITINSVILLPQKKKSGEKSSKK